LVTFVQRSQNDAIGALALEFGQRRGTKGIDEVARAIGRDDQQRRVAAPCEKSQCRDGLRIAPVRVIERHGQMTASLRFGDKRIRHTNETASHEFLRRDVVAVGRAERLDGVAGEVAARIGTCDLFECIDDRRIRRRALGRRADVQKDVANVCATPRKLGDEPRFPDAGISANRHQSHAAFERALIAKRNEPIELGFTTDDLLEEHRTRNHPVNAPQTSLVSDFSRGRSPLSLRGFGCGAFGATKIRAPAATFPGSRLEPFDSGAGVRHNV